MLPFYMYTDMPKLSEHKVVAQIDTDALVYNYRKLCNMTPDVHHICVVKADAYGHVTDICVPALLEAGCDFFAVSCIEEAISVRKICREYGSDADILILGYTDPSQAGALARNEIIQTLLSVEYACRLNDVALAEGCRVRTHVAVDTGMNRIGIPAMSDVECDKAAEAIKRIISLEHLKTEGMFTHFARSDEEYEKTVLPSSSHTRIQASRFIKVKERLEKDGIKLFCHACNSAAAVRFPEYAFDAVRLGIVLYGIRPSEHVEVELKPVMTLKTLISHIHTLKSGETVSYGGRYCSDDERKIATLPIGYADGFMRAYEGFYMTVRNAQGSFKAQVVGRVCMDQSMIDVTDLPVSVGDEVTVFGEDSASLSELARLADTIEYECICLVSARVPRVKKINARDNDIEKAGE
jgi:alanine racemase